MARHSNSLHTAAVALIFLLLNMSVAPARALDCPPGTYLPPNAEQAECIICEPGTGSMEGYVNL